MSVSISAGKGPVLSALRVTVALVCLALVSATAASALPGRSAAGSSFAASTFGAQTAYLDDPPPSVGDAITVSSASAFIAAIDDARAGDTINVLGNVRVPGEFTGFDRVVSGGVVNVVFQRGAGFTGMAGSQLPAIWLHSSGGWRIWGGTISNPDGNGLLVYAMPGPFTWTGFTVSNTGDTCVAVYPVWGNIEGLVLKGVAGTADPGLALVGRQRVDDQAQVAPGGAGERGAGRNRDVKLLTSHLFISTRCPSWSASCRPRQAGSLFHPS